MQILLSLNDSFFEKSKSPLFFGITWNHEDIYYPSKNWTDFGEVLLSWWIGTLIKLLEGQRKSEFSFMDGPYSISVTFLPETGFVELLPDGFDEIWKVPMKDLIEIVVLAANTVSKEFKKRNLEGKEALEKSISLLRSAQNSYDRDIGSTNRGIN